MQVCTPLSTGPCATQPSPSGKPTVNLSPAIAALRADALTVLDVVISSDGKPHDIEVIRSGNATTEDAIDLVKKLRFTPGSYMFKPVPVEIRILVRFHNTGEVNILTASSQMSWADPEQVQKLFTGASQAYSRHDFQAAVTLSRQLIMIEPLLLRIRLTLGASLLELNEYADAEKVLQEELKLDPKSSYAHNMLGMVLWREHKYEDAVTQFRQQIDVTPDGYDAHANLGVLLCFRKQCAQAMPELDKALALSPNQARALLAHGECNVDLGNPAKGISEMEQAANQSGSAASWNQAAYRLAERNVELERAERWAETAIAMESVSLRNLSLEHVTPTQMRLMNSISNYWDTLGWIYFGRGQIEQARIYVEAAWGIHPSPIKGDHLGQIYEKLGRNADAIHAYSMAIASADLSTRAPANPEAVAESLERLTKIAGPAVQTSDLIKQSHADVEGLGSVTVENTTNHSGSADFTLRITGDKILEARQIGGDSALASLAESLRDVHLAVATPEGVGFEILRRATLTCKSDTRKCRLTPLRAEDAFDLATKEAASAKPTSPE